MFLKNREIYKDKYKLFTVLRCYQHRHLTDDQKLICVTLLIQFRIALQVRQRIGAQFKITEKLYQCTTIWLGTQNTAL